MSASEGGWRIPSSPIAGPPLRENALGGELDSTITVKKIRSSQNVCLKLTFNGKPRMKMSASEGGWRTPSLPIVGPPLKAKSLGDELELSWEVS